MGFSPPFEFVTQPVTVEYDRSPKSAYNSLHIVLAIYPRQTRVLILPRILVQSLPTMIVHGVFGCAYSSTSVKSKLHDSIKATRYRTIDKRSNQLCT